MRLRVPALICSGIVVGGITTAASRQAQAPPAAGNSEPLLTEVRALRTEIQQLAAANLRAQLLVGRLQLQVPRLTDIAAQLAEARRGIAANQAAQAAPIASLNRAQEGMAQGLKGYDTAIKEAKAKLDDLQREERTLRSQELQLQQLLDAEQARWTDLSARLDDLDRGIK